MNPAGVDERAVVSTTKNFELNLVQEEQQCHRLSENLDDGETCFLILVTPLMW